MHGADEPRPLLWIHPAPCEPRDPARNPRADMQDVGTFLAEEAPQGPHLKERGRALSVDRHRHMPGAAFFELFNHPASV